MTRIVTNSLLHPTNRSIKNVKSKFETSDGPNMSTFIDLLDIGIPYDSHYTSRIVLPAGEQDFLLNYGLNNDATFLLIKVTYNGNYDLGMEDSYDPSYYHEPNNYNIEYYFEYKGEYDYVDEDYVDDYVESGTGKTYPIGRLLMLNGSINHKIPKIYLNNNLDYDVVLDVLHANVDLPIVQPGGSGITITNLYFNDIITNQVICGSYTTTTTTNLTITKFAILGDTGQEPLTPTILVADKVKSHNPEFIVHLGDMNYSPNYEVTMYPNFLDIWSGYTNDNMYVTFGNHDLESSTGSSYYSNYGKVLLDQLPAVSNLIGTTKINNRLYCYDFVRGPIHFFEFNTGEVSDYLSGDPYVQLSTQLTEMIPIISASTSTWKIVFLHMPPYSNDLYHSPGILEMRLDYDLLGVDVVLGGHAHNFEYFISGNTKYMVNGIGGANFRPTTEPYLEQTIFSYSGNTDNMNYGYTIAIATEEYVIFDTYTIDDVLLHTFNIGTLPVTTTTTTLEPITTTTTTTNIKELMKITKTYINGGYKYESTGLTLGLFDYYKNGNIWIYDGEESDHVIFNDLTDIIKIRFYFELNDYYYGTLKTEFIDPIEHNNGLYCIDIDLDCNNLPIYQITGITSGITTTTTTTTNYIVGVMTGSTSFIINEFKSLVPTGFTIYQYEIFYNTIISILKDISYDIIYISTTEYYYTLKFLTSFDCSKAYYRMVFSYESYLDNSCRYLTVDNAYLNDNVIDCVECITTTTTTTL